MSSSQHTPGTSPLSLLLYLSGLFAILYTGHSLFIGVESGSGSLYIGFGLIVVAFILDHVKKNKAKYFFDLTWPEYKKEGYTRDEWESMRDNPEKRVMLQRTAADEDAKRKKTRIDCGKVINISVDRGSLCEGTISQIDTDKGSYRVRGDVGSVNKGEMASIRGDLFYLGVVTEKRKFLLIK